MPFTPPFATLVVPAAGVDAPLSATTTADTVVVTDGARVFLDEAANTALDDRVLDAELGQDGSVRFALGSQA